MKAHLHWREAPHMIRRIILLLALLAPAGLVLWMGCKQGLNERCQINDDCDQNQGLVCQLTGNSPAQGGVCINPNADGGLADLTTAGPARDLSTPPAPDLAPSDGGATPDLGDLG